MVNYPKMILKAKGTSSAMLLKKFFPNWKEIKEFCLSKKMKFGVARMSNVVAMAM